MDILWYMDRIYPVLSFQQLFYAFLLLLTYQYIERLHILHALATYMFIEFLITGALSLVTGNDPAFNIDIIRPYIVWLRLALSICLTVCIVLQTKRVVRGR